MTLKKRILIGIGALALMVLLALNVHLVNTYHSQDEGFASFSLVELEVQAQGEGEGNNCLGTTTTCIGDCLVFQVTPEKLYTWSINLRTCTPKCATGGDLCCPVWLTTPCCCAIL